MGIYLPYISPAQVIADWSAGLSAAGMLGGGAGGDAKGKPAFSLLSFLSSEGQLLRWKSQGLPADKLSSENAIVILNAPQPPLIIDPSSQATGWLKTYLEAQQVPLECVTPHEARLANPLSQLPPPAPSPAWLCRDHHTCDVPD